MFSCFVYQKRDGSNYAAEQEVFSIPDKIALPVAPIATLDKCLQVLGHARSFDRHLEKKNKEQGSFPQKLLAVLLERVGAMEKDLLKLKEVCRNSYVQQSEIASKFILSPPPTHPLNFASTITHLFPLCFLLSFLVLCRTRGLPLLWRASSCFLSSKVCPPSTTHASNNFSMPRTLKKCSRRPDRPWKATKRASRQ